MVVLVRDFGDEPADLDDTSHWAQAHFAPRAHARRRALPRVLWGKALVSCADCGATIAPERAYRPSMGQAYCCLEHAQRDAA